MGYVPPSAYSCVAAISHLFSLCSGFSEWWGTLLPCGSERLSVDIVSAVHVSELLPVVSVGTLSPLSHSLVPCPTSTFHLGVANRYLPHEFECIQYGSHNTLTEYIWENLSSDTRSFLQFHVWALVRSCLSHTLTPSLSPSRVLYAPL